MASTSKDDSPEVPSVLGPSVDELSDERDELVEISCWDLSPSSVPLSDSGVDGGGWFRCPSGFYDNQ